MTLPNFAVSALLSLPAILSSKIAILAYIIVILGAVIALAVIVMLKEVGKNMSWYGADGWLGLTRDDAWMFCCYYTEEVFEEEPEEEILIGDIDGDGDINPLDSSFLKRIITGKLAVKDTDPIFIAADIDGSGDINSLDSNMLKRMIVGKQ